MFRFYECLGGNSSILDRQTFTANYSVFLLFLASSLYAPDSSPDVEHFVDMLIFADSPYWSDLLSMGIGGKALRWCFEKQELYGGLSPDVDIYFQDGRHGGYYQGTAFDFTKNSAVWNRNAADGGSKHQQPITGVENYAYAKIKNRGRNKSDGVVVDGWFAVSGTGLIWPDDFTPLATQNLTVSEGVDAGSEVTVGPFFWTPTPETNALLFSIKTLDDVSIIDEYYPYNGTKTIELWKLVPMDNNICMRRLNYFPKSICPLQRAYAHHDVEELNVLRNVRDNVIAKSNLGVRFIQFYYSFANKMTPIMDKSAGLRKLVRVALRPIIKHYSKLNVV